MTNEAKPGMEQIGLSQLELFLANIASQTSDLRARGIIGNVADEYLAETGTSITDQSLFANEIGVKLFERQIFDAAVECFQFALLVQNPYKNPVTIYASSFLNAVNEHWKSLPEDLKTEERGWLEAKKPFIGRAVDCVTHFRDDAIFEEGYIQAPKQDNGQLSLSWNTDRLNQVNKLDAFAAIGNNLLTQ